MSARSCGRPAGGREFGKSASSVLSFYSPMVPKNDRALRVREMARQRIQSGELPNRKPRSTWGGSGEGARCAVCDENVSPDEFELEFAVHPEDGRNGATCRMHVSCYTAWEAELLDGSAPAVCSEATNSPVGLDAIDESETSIGLSR